MPHTNIVVQHVRLVEYDHYPSNLSRLKLTKRFNNQSPAVLLCGTFSLLIVVRSLILFFNNLHLCFTCMIWFLQKSSPISSNGLFLLSQSSVSTTWTDISGTDLAVDLSWPHGPGYGLILTTQTWLWTHLDHTDLAVDSSFSTFIWSYQCDVSEN